MRTTTRTPTALLLCALFAAGCSDGAPGAFKPVKINGFHVYEVGSYQGPRPDWVEAEGAAHCLYKLITQLNGDNPHSEIYTRGKYQGRRGCYDSNFTPGGVGQFDPKTGELTSGGIKVSIIAHNPEKKQSLVWLIDSDGECRLCDNEIFLFEETTKPEDEVFVRLDDRYQFEQLEMPVIRRLATISVVSEGIRQHAFSQNRQPYDVMKELLMNAVVKYLSEDY